MSDEDLIKAAAEEVLGQRLVCDNGNCMLIDEEGIIVTLHWDPTLKKNSAQTDMLRDKLVEMGCQVDESVRQNRQIVQIIYTGTIALKKEPYNPKGWNKTRTQAYVEAVRSLRKGEV